MGDVKENSLLIRNGKENNQRTVAISPYVKKLIMRYVKCRDARFKDRIIDKKMKRDKLKLSQIMLRIVR